MDILNCTVSWNPQFLIFTSQAPQLLYYSHVPTALIALFLGMFVFIKSKRSLVSKILLFISVIFLLWSFAELYIWTNSNSYIMSFVWSLINLLEMLVSASILYFAYVFIEKKDAPLKYKIAVLLLFLPFIVLMPTKINLTGFDLSICEATQGKLVYYFYFLEAFFSSWLLSYLIKKIINTHGEERKRVVYISLGTSLFLVAFSGTNIISSAIAYFFGSDVSGTSWEITQYGLFGMVVFMGFLAYLIVKFKAFDIKILGSQALVVSLISLIGALFFYVTETGGKILILINLILASGFGYMLVRSVKKEVKQKEALEIANKEINERKEQLQKMSDSLAQANDRLRQLDQAKTDFVSMASHQLRRSPTSIKGFTSLMLEGSYGALTPELKDVLEKVYKSNEVQIAFVEDLLNVSRLESGSVKFEFAPAGIEELCQDAVDALELKAKDNGLYLDYRKPKSPLPELMIDKSKIREVISNLVDNAIKYTKKGGVTLAVDICDKKQKNCLSGEHLRITVSDTGIGIPATEIPYLFSKFSRGKDTRRLNANGTGLGLYVVKMMTEGNGGKVWVESDGDSKGSRFIIELPLKQSSETLARYA